jgi:hypothetical protein
MCLLQRKLFLRPLKEMKIYGVSDNEQEEETEEERISREMFAKSQELLAIENAILDEREKKKDNKPAPKIQPMITLKENKYMKNKGIKACVDIPNVTPDIKKKDFSFPPEKPNKTRDFLKNKNPDYDVGDALNQKLLDILKFSIRNTEDKEKELKEEREKEAKAAAIAKKSKRMAKPASQLKKHIMKRKKPKINGFKLQRVYEAIVAKRITRKLWKSQQIFGALKYAEAALNNKFAWHRERARLLQQYNYAIKNNRYWRWPVGIVEKYEIFQPRKPARKLLSNDILAAFKLKSNLFVKQNLPNFFGNPFELPPVKLNKKILKAFAPIKTASNTLTVQRANLEKKYRTFIRRLLKLYIYLFKQKKLKKRVQVKIIPLICRSIKSQLLQFIEGINQPKEDPLETIKTAKKNLEDNEIALYNDLKKKNMLSDRAYYLKLRNKITGIFKRIPAQVPFIKNVFKDRAFHTRFPLVKSKLLAPKSCTCSIDFMRTIA